MRWMDAVVDIDKIHDSSSWSCLIRRGGEDFVSQLAPLYFIMRLNVAHIQISKMHESPYFSGMLAEDALKSAVRSVKKGFWLSEYRYVPSTPHMTKLRYRYAIFFRLQGHPKDANRALTYIDSALRLAPGDAAIIKERDNILAWTQQSGQ
jgi:hypothetical protein